MPKPSPTEHIAGGSVSGGIFVGVVVALALLAIGYLVFTASPIP